MFIRWLPGLNCTLLGLTLLLGLMGVIYWLKQPKEIICGNVRTKDCRLPKGAFELEENAYQHAGEALFVLQQTPPTMQLPDLRQLLIYYGKNGRPDAQSHHTMLHFSLNGSNKKVVSVSPKERLYLVYDRQSSPNHYNFSPNNEKTSLWIEGSVVDHEAQIQVTMENDKGELIAEPSAFAQFRLPEKEFIRYAEQTGNLDLSE